MKKNIALLAGGYSGESVVSLKSAAQIEKSIPADKYTVYKIIITRDSWSYTDASGKVNEIDRNDFSLNLENQKVKFDCVFIAIHGTPGEDGMLQGYFEMLGIPYTTCDSFTSALTFNKSYTNCVIAAAGVNVAKSMPLFEGQPVTEAEILAKLTLPVFVKPNNGGSSLGTSKVKEAGELKEAIERAFKEDKQVLVEEFIKGREFTCGVVKRNNEVTVLPVTEIKSSKEFFDFEAKYTPGLTEEITPADIDPELLKTVHLNLKRSYLALNCRGVVRIDFFLQEGTNKFYFLEVNTVPGQTETSLIPQQVAAMGWNISDFYSSLIEEAVR
ncbi:D-alanine--D-alanine ligase [Solitalea canadensis]|uniref:D-alanine--D-alanine ligase n=1 Tax=Solitalea canadensis (strain ATCC 29591 / DSM 3403 / JCM 21819 / LMG 8368 / NBRC 15130 / NCIMB 12057 / USAM 9D) TaxID=929556 RepID=H8KVW2_SOLCM|nr:D-alanine--D-alanine ligase [Solitalea canadensis]AFD06865.1 D-alanine--D-alanine ligase [Solitalea canadensis DSM 3403]